MKIYKLKKNLIFSLIAIMFCCVLIYATSSNKDIVGFVNTKIEIIKEKEMEYMFGERNTSDDKYSNNSLEVFSIGNVNYQTDKSKPNITTLIPNSEYQQQNLLVDRQYKNVSFSDFITTYSKYQATSDQLKTLVEEDSYRNKKLGFYYIFDYEYTMDALKELEPIIEKTAKAQKMPKALVKSVLFREMMFLGQEDLLDGVNFIGGKSMGICQIGIENVRFNEHTVHGKESVIADKTDDEIIHMLKNPKQAVYFCAVQLRARAIKMTNNKNVNLNDLDDKQILKIYEEYNQSKIKKTIGPIKTKSKYAEETFKYYEIFSEMYKSETQK